MRQSEGPVEVQHSAENEERIAWLKGELGKKLESEKLAYVEGVSVSKSQISAHGRK